MPSPQRAPLELGEAGEHGDDQPAVSVGCVDPRIAQRLEARAALVDGGEQVEQVASRARQAVEPADCRA